MNLICKIKVLYWKCTFMCTLKLAYYSKFRDYPRDSVDEIRPVLCHIWHWLSEGNALKSVEKYFTHSNAFPSDPRQFLYYDTNLGGKYLKVHGYGKEKWTRGKIIPALGQANPSKWPKHRSSSNGNVIEALKNAGVNFYPRAIASFGINRCNYIDFARDCGNFKSDT